MTLQGGMMMLGGQRQNNLENLILNANYDPHNANANEVNKFLADELKNLSFQDREAMNEEIHGVGNINTVEETPEVVEKALYQMKMDVERIRQKPAYERAVFMNSQYVLSTNKTFWLAFLRAELFNTQKAATRFVRHLDFLVQHFGEVALMRPIYYSDLVETDLDVIRCGWVRLLSRRDVVGRRILKLGGPAARQSMYHMMRISLYFYSLTMFDEETSKRGIIIVNHVCPEMFNNFHLSDHQAIGALSSCIPCRIAAMHFLVPEDEKIAQFVRAACMVWSPSVSDRVRVKLHFGSPTEWQYQLLGFGIPVSELSPMLNGVPDPKAVNRSLIAYEAVDDARQRFAMDQGTFCDPADFPWVLCPTRFDILFAQGGNGWSHIGNEEFRTVLESRRGEHADAQNKVKARIVDEIVRDLEKRNYRFLSYDKQHAVWIVIDDPAAIRQKVAVGMRDHIKRHRKRVSDRQTEHSDTLFFLQNNEKRQKSGSGLWCKPP